MSRPLSFQKSHMRFLCLCIILIFSSSCNKSSCGEAEPKATVQSGKALVLWNGMPEADGLGWIFYFESGKIEKPTNLADQFKIDSLHITVSYEPSNEKFPCHCSGGSINMVKIVSIARQ